MPATYKRLKEIFDKRRKGYTYKATNRDCRVTQDGDDFIVTYHGWYTRYNNNLGIPLVRVTPTNLLTTLTNTRRGESDEKYCVTLQNRMSLMLGRLVSSDKRNHGNYEHYVRMSDGTNYYNANLPFHEGMQLQMDDDGKIIDIPVIKDDIKMVINKEITQRVKADTAVLRKLVKGMARMGAFDVQIHARANGKVLALEEDVKIDPQNPTGSDAEHIFMRGLNSSYAPHSGYVDGTWTSFPIEMRVLSLRDKAISNGLKWMRTELYTKEPSAYIKVKHEILKNSDR